MRVGIYDRYWTTYGGGERFAAGIARTLVDQHDVVLLGPEPLDIDRLSARIGLDLSGTTFRRAAHDDDVSRSSADVDLFVNCTYLSPVVNLARSGIYIVHFPIEGARPQVPSLTRMLRGARRRPDPAACFRVGFHEPEPDGSRWTSGFAVMSVDAPEGGRLTAEISVDHTPSPETWRVTTKVGTSVCTFDALHRSPRLSVDLPATGDGPPVVVAIASPDFNPVEAFGTVDNRRLGVRVADIRVDGRPVRARRSRFDLTGGRHDLAYLSSYDRLAANSRYTASWCRALWGIDADVLNPPVQLRQPRTKTRSIVSIGRFFASQRGHSKKQLEMVEAFRALGGDVLGEWELHLVGGCSTDDRDYGLAVRRAAQGLPVHVHFNAPPEDLDDLIGQASIYWHATGIGEDPDRRPHRMEHFGIAIVEAMSAGAVPIVYGHGGPRDIVRHDVDGLHFADLAGLVRGTRRLIGEPDLRCRLAANARERATEYGMTPFRRHFAELVDRTVPADVRRRSVATDPWSTPLPGPPILREDPVTTSVPFDEPSEMAIPMALDQPIWAPWDQL